MNTLHQTQGAAACRPAATSPTSAAARRAGQVAEGVYDTRRARLKLLIAERTGGSQRAFAKLLGYTRSNIHHFLSTTYNHGRSMGERAARKLEHKAGLPYGWLDQVVEAATPAPAQCGAVIVSAMEGYDAYVESCRARGVLPCSRQSFDADQTCATGRTEQAGREGAVRAAPGSAEARMAAGFQVLAEVGADDVLVISRSALMTLARQLMAEELDDCEEEFLSGRAHGIGSLHATILQHAAPGDAPENLGAQHRTIEPGRKQ